MDATNQKTSTSTSTNSRTKSHTLLCLITGPSGSGKTSIALELQKRFLPPVPVPSTNHAEPTVVATVIHQDRYFTMPFLPYQDRTDDSYETGASIDWDRILADIESLAVDAAETNEHTTKVTTTATMTTTTTTTATATTSTGAAAKRRQTTIIIVEGHLLGELAPRLRQRFFGGGHSGDRPLGRNSSRLVDSVLAVLLVGCSSQTCKRRRIERNPYRSADEADVLAGYYDAHVWPSFLTHGRRAMDAIQREFAAPSSVSRSGPGCPTGTATAKRRDDAPFPVGFVLEIDNSETASREANIESIAKKIRDMVSCR